MLNKIHVSRCRIGETPDVILVPDAQPSGTKYLVIGYSTGYAGFELGGISRTPYWATKDKYLSDVWVRTYYVSGEIARFCSLVGKETPNQDISLTRIDTGDVCGAIGTYNGIVLTEDDVGKEIPLKFTPPYRLPLIAANAASMKEVA